MIDLTQLLGQHAVSLADSEMTGTVKGVRFEGNRIVSVDIGGGRTVPAEAVKSFEGEALTYEGDAVDAQTSPADDDDADATRSDADPEVLAGVLPLAAASVLPRWGNPIGTLLLSETGDALGTLNEMHIDTDGVIAEIVDDRGHSHSGDRVLTVGSYATIMTAAG